MRLRRRVAVTSQCEHASDAVLAVQSFADSPDRVGAAFADYHGLVTVRRGYRLGTLAAPPLNTATWLLRLRRRRLHLEPMSLPPELQSSGDRKSAPAPAPAAAAAGGPGCTSSAIDF